MTALGITISDMKTGRFLSSILTYYEKYLAAQNIQHYINFDKNYYTIIYAYKQKNIIILNEKMIW